MEQVETCGRCGNKLNDLNWCSWCGSPPPSQTDNPISLEGTFWIESSGKLDIGWKFLASNKVISTCIYGPSHGNWKLSGKKVELFFENQAHHRKRQYIGEIQSPNKYNAINIEGHSLLINEDNSVIKTAWCITQTDANYFRDWKWD